MDVRWIRTWKLINGQRQIKWRLTICEFRDHQTSLEIYAEDVSCIGIQQPERELLSCELFSKEATQAFEKGSTCRQLLRLTGTQLRAVEFKLPQGEVALIRKLVGLNNFDTTCEVSRMLKPSGGLKDVHKVCEKCLHQTLGALLGRQLFANLLCTGRTSSMDIWTSRSAPSETTDKQRKT